MAPKIIKPHVRVSRSKVPVTKPTRMVVSHGFKPGNSKYTRPSLHCKTCGATRSKH